MNTTILLRRILLFAVTPLLCWQPAVYAQTSQNDITLDKLSDQQALQTLLYGYLLSAEGNYSEAAHLIGNIGMARNDGAILESAVRIAIQARQFNLARRYAAIWASLDDGVRARQTQAELAILTGDLAQAEQILAELMRDGAQTPAELRRQLTAVADKAAAIQMGERLFPKTVDGYHQYALLALLLSQLSTADLAATAALEASAAKRLDVLFLAGRIAQRVHGDSAPLAIMQRHADRNCGGAVRHCTLDALLWAFSQYLRNEPGWEDALATGPINEQEWSVAAGNWYLQWEMTDAARASYLRGGNLFHARFGLAELAEDEGNIDLALDILRNASVATSDELVMRETTIAHLLSEQGDLAGAIALLDKALKTLPDDFSLMYHQSLLLEQNHDIDGALKVLRRITEVFPDNPDGWNALGYVMADHNIDLTSAKKYIERALLDRPNDPNIIDSLGWVQYRLGNLASARLHLQKAAKLSRSAEIYAHYGEVLWEMGNSGEARRIWQEAKGFAPDNELLIETIKRYTSF